jgi:hypothetical protein
MTLSVFIAESENRSDKDIKYFRKKVVTQRIAKSLWRQLPRDERHYALIVNFLDPKIDIILCSENGCGVINLKACHGTIAGPVGNLWHDIDETGATIEIVKTETNAPNPLEQVREYKDSLLRKLIGYNERQHSLPSWVSQEGNFVIQGAVAFTSPHFELNLLKIEDKDKSWFSLLWMEDIPTWIRHLEFGREHHRHGLVFQMSGEQLKSVATQVLGAHLWQEIDSNLGNEESYGELHLHMNDGFDIVLELDQNEMTIGRGPLNSLPLPSSIFGSVSRKQGTIIRRNNHVYIIDRNSNHGTWINGNRVEANIENVLTDGDEILLGDYKKEYLAASARLKYKVKPRVESQDIETI